LPLPLTFPLILSAFFVLAREAAGFAILSDALTFFPSTLASLPSPSQKSSHEGLAAQLGALKRLLQAVASNSLLSARFSNSTAPETLKN
jgi:hypothetical protein